MNMKKNAEIKLLLFIVNLAYKTRSFLSNIIVLHTYYNYFQ